MWSHKESYYIKYVCFGQMSQHCNMVNADIRQKLRRLEDGIWVSFDNSEGHKIASSKETEKAYQDYLEELSELTLLWEVFMTNNYSFFILVYFIIFVCFLSLLGCTQDYNSYDCDYARLGGIQYLEECLEWKRLFFVEPIDVSL